MLSRIGKGGEPAAKAAKVAAAAPDICVRLASRPSGDGLPVPGAGAARGDEGCCCCSPRAENTGISPLPGRGCARAAVSFSGPVSACRHGRWIAAERDRFPIHTCGKGSKGGTSAGHSVRCSCLSPRPSCAPPPAINLRASEAASMSARKSDACARESNAPPHASRSVSESLRLKASSKRGREASRTAKSS